MRESSLTTRFAVLSAAVVTVLGLALAVVLDRVLERRARADAMASAELVTRVAIDPLLAGADLRRGLTAQQAARLDAAVRSGLERGVLARVKVFDRDAVLVHSDEPANVGKRAGEGSPVHQALRGRVTSDFAVTSQADHATERGLGRLLEVFVPLHADGDQRPDGVAELYVPYDEVAAETAEDTRRLLAVVAAGLALLWAAMFRVVRRASRRLAAELARNQHSALHDALTGLPNRVLLFDRVERALLAGRRSGASTAVLLLDLDRFKEVNDTLGHHNGDQLLVEVAERLSAALRDADTLARLGGDEFAVLLPAVEDDDAATEVAQRLLAALASPVTVSGLSVHVDVSIGIALAPDDADSPQLLLQHADVAMYDAKRSRSGVVRYAAESDTYSPDRLALLGELRQAISDDALVLHFQPKSDVLTGRLLGAEALVRWPHPERGLVPPDQFVQLAEHSGLIHDLTRWVLDEALATAAAWRADGVDLPVSVNVSVRNLGDVSFPDVVAAALARHRTPSDRLVVEITETALMADPETAKDVLRRLKELGVALSIDDYGSGYSSLAYLQHLPVDELKIDRAFVRHLADSERDRAIVRSAVELGRNLGLRVVAEGVEDAGAWSALAELRCDQLQGYFLCRPLPGEDLVRWLREYVAAPPHEAAPV